MFDIGLLELLIVAVVVIVAISGISLVKTRWRTTWGVSAGGRI